MPRAMAHSSYTDVIPLWNLAIQNSGLLLKCSNRTNAEKLRGRLNSYRAALRRHQNSLYLIPGMEAQIEHDKFEITLTLFCEVKIAPRLPTHLASITNLEGKPIALDQKSDDDLI